MLVFIFQLRCLFPLIQFGCTTFTFQSVQLFSTIIIVTINISNDDTTTSTSCQYHYSKIYYPCHYHYYKKTKKTKNLKKSQRDGPTTFSNLFSYLFQFQNIFVKKLFRHLAMGVRFGKVTLNGTREVFRSYVAIDWLFF